MTAEQASAMAALSLFAAFADGSTSDEERTQVRQVVASLGNPNLSDILRKVVMKETTPAAEAAVLTTEPLRSLAWESALAVREANGATTAAERAFLDDLAVHLKRSLSAVNWSTGPALTFATTYAMGMVAKPYYAGGRTISAINLRTLYAQNVEHAKSLYSRYEPQIQQTARTTSPAALLQSLRA